MMTPGQQIEKSFFGMGDTRTYREVWRQIRHLPDHVLQEWAYTTRIRCGSKVYRVQRRFIYNEIARNR